MLLLLSDEDAHGPIVKGLLRVEPRLDLVRARDVGLGSATDVDVLEWAAAHGRVVITHDRNTLVSHAYDRVRRGLPMPDVIVMDDDRSEGDVIEGALIVAACYSQEEMRDQVVYVPF